MGICVEPNTAEGSVKVSLTTSIPELQITDNISTTFSQTIAITIRSKYEKNADTPSEAKELNEAVLVKGFSEKSEEVLGMALAVMSTLLDEKVLETVRDVVVAVTASAVIVMVLKILGTFMEGLVLSTKVDNIGKKQNKGEEREPKKVGVSKKAPADMLWLKC